MRDFLVGLHEIVQHDVEVELPLQQLYTEVQSEEIGNTADAARFDIIKAKGFWGARQDAFFDVRVTNPLAATAMKMPLSSLYDRYKKEKKRQYNHSNHSIG